MKRTAMLMALLLGAAFFGGCVYHPLGFAASTIPMGYKDYVKIGPAEGVAKSVYVLFLPLSLSKNPMRDALDDAMRNTKADALVDVAVDTSTHYYLLFTVQKTKVHATAVSFSKR
jgi:hypothetical protein